MSADAPSIMVVEMTVRIPVAEDLLAAVSIRRTDRGTLTASMHTIPGKTLPNNAPGLLRWLADALEIDMLEVAPDAP